MSVQPKSGDAKPRSYALLSADIDEKMIRAVVYGFYERVRIDPVIGPVFQQRIDNWPVHLEKMVDFWSSGLLRTQRYRGKPLRVHKQIEELGVGHFNRWLELFEETTHELCPSRQAAVFMGLAQRMGLAMTTALGLDPPGEHRASMN